MTIRRKLAEGWRGPVLLKWLEELLANREELLARLGALEAASDPEGQPSSRHGERAGFGTDKPESSQPLGAR